MMLRACLAAAGLTILLAGCGGNTYPIAPVSGKVTLDGKPLANAGISFVPLT